MRIDYSKVFIKHLQKAPIKIQKKFRERLDLFSENKLDPILRNHLLKGKWKGYRSININGDWRAIYHDMGDGTIEWVEFVEIGTHSDLYK